MSEGLGPTGPAEGMGPAFDPAAPYARLAVVGLISRLADGSGEEEWLLLRRTGETELWDPAGGRVERGEDLESAVQREMLEETGLSVRVAGPCFAYLTFHKGERLVAVSMACHADGEAGAIRLEPDNAVEWRWSTVSDWEGLADAGKTSWERAHVRSATRLASTIWEAIDDER